MKRAFLAGLSVLVPLLLIGWMYNALPGYRTWVVIGGIGGLMTSCRCHAKMLGGRPS